MAKVPDDGIVDLEGLLNLLAEGEFHELHRVGLEALGAGSSPMGQWLLVLVVESASRWLAELDIVDHYRREIDERTERVARDRDRMLDVVRAAMASARIASGDSAIRTDTIQDAGDSKCRLTVQSFGRFTARVDGQPVTGWSGTKSQHVLKFLLTQPGRSAPKGVIMDALWPDADASTSRRRLHQAVYTLRQALGAIRPDVEFILFEQDHYLLNPDIDVDDDVAQFEAVVARCRSSGPVAPEDLKERAAALLDLYRGDFLDDTLYEDWAIRERSRLRLEFLTAAEHSAEALLDLGLVDDAVPLLQRVLEVDPCDERAHRMLMKVHHDAGHMRFVTAQYGACSESLRQELGVEPSSETVELLQSLLGSEPSAASEVPRSVATS